MNKQQKYDKLFADSSQLSANMSHCNRLKVGAVLVKDQRIIANSWNGTIRGLSNCCETPEGTTSDFTLHAEQNLISFCARKGIPTESTTLYITHAPCAQCSKLIAQSGITEVVFSDYYKSTDGIDFLTQCGVTVRKA